MPGDPLHAAGVRGGGAADRGRGRRAHPHPRAQTGRHAFYEIEDFQAITDAIREEVGDAAIINYSTGTIGVPVAKRIEYLRACRPEVAALNMGSMNYAKYSRSKKQFVFNMVFENPFGEIIELLEAMNELGIKPEHECFDVGHVGSLAPLIDMGVLKEPLHVDCVMGVVGGIPPTARNLAAMVDNIPGRASHWGVIGISRDQWMLVSAALTLGGSIRVGLEDNLYLPDGDDGALQRRADREGEADDRRRGTAAGERAGGPREAGDPAARGEPRVRIFSAAGSESAYRVARPLAPAAGRLLLAAAGGLRRGRGEGRGHRHGRLHPLVAAVLRGRPRQREVGAVPVAESQQALDSPGPEERGRPRGAARAGARRATWCSNRSARACSTASGSATSGCASVTRGSSSARSRATARMAPSATRRATT